MTVSFVGAASAEATSLTLPAHQAGDLLVMYARGLSASPTPPTLPSGWLQVLRFSVSTNNVAFCYQIASAAGTASGTWANAQHLMCVVYRHTTNLLAIGLPSSASGTNTATVNYPSVTAYPLSGWVLGMGSAKNDSNINTDFDLAPSGMTNRHSSYGATHNYEITAHDTNADVASWPNTTRTNSDSVRFATITAPIVVLSTKSSGGIQIARGMFGGMRG